MPDLVVGDMEAQVSAARIGAERFSDLIQKYGLETITAAYVNLLDYSETLMCKAIEEVPDGTYYAETFIDGFLDSEDANLKDIKIAASINVKGSMHNFTYKIPPLIANSFCKLL